MNSVFMIFGPSLGGELFTELSVITLSAAAAFPPANLCDKKYLSQPRLAASWFEKRISLD